MEDSRAPYLVAWVCSGSAEDLSCNRFPIDKHGYIIARESITGRAFENPHEAIPCSGRDAAHALKAMFQRIREANINVSST
jgi:hypothetical protein